MSRRPAPSVSFETMSKLSAAVTGTIVGLGSTLAAAAPATATPPGDASGVIAFNGLTPGSGVLWRAQTIHPDGSGDQAMPTHSGPGAVTGGEYDYSPDGAA